MALFLLFETIEIFLRLGRCLMRKFLIGLAVLGALGGAACDSQKEKADTAADKAAADKAAADKAAADKAAAEKAASETPATPAPPANDSSTTQPTPAPAP